MISKIEFDWAVQQLIGGGFVDQKRDKSGELIVGLTDMGYEYCEAFLNKMSVMDRLCLLLYHNDKRLELVGPEDE